MIITKLGLDNYYGFSLENSDRRFYLEDFTVTHNSTFVDSAFIIEPYIHMINNPNIRIDFFYWSLEMGKLVVRYKAAAHFFYRDYGISTVTLPQGKTHKGSPIIPMQSSYLLSRMKCDDGEPIEVQQEHRGIFGEIIRQRINPMYGEYDTNGKILRDV